jgi:hypothetical protein
MVEPARFSLTRLAGAGSRPDNSCGAEDKVYHVSWLQLHRLCMHRHRIHIGNIRSGRLPRYVVTHRGLQGLQSPQFAGALLKKVHRPLYPFYVAPSAPLMAGDYVNGSHRTKLVSDQRQRPSSVSRETANAFAPSGGEQDASGFAGTPRTGIQIVMCGTTPSAASRPGK